MRAGARSVSLQIEMKHHRWKRGANTKNPSYNHSLCNKKFTNQAPVQSMVTTKVFERLQIDLVDMRKKSVVCNRVEYSYILSIMDCFLRFIFLR